MNISYTLTKSIINTDWLILNESGECLAVFTKEDIAAAQTVLGILNRELVRIEKLLEKDREITLNAIHEAVWGSGISNILRTDNDNICLLCGDEKFIYDGRGNRLACPECNANHLIDIDTKDAP